MTAPKLNWIEYLPSKQRVAGSSPAGAAKSLKGSNLYRKLFFDLRRWKIVRHKTKSHLLLVNNIDFRKLTLAYLPR